MAAKRFQTIHGVPLPPWKKHSIGAGSTTIKFIITGKVISKKNNNQAIAMRKKPHDWAFSQAKVRPATWADVHKAINMVRGKMIGNTEYKKFLEKNSPIIKKQMSVWFERLSSKGLIFPVPKSTISIRLYIKDKYRRDTLNAMQTICDLLVDAGVLYDDDDLNLNPVFGESAKYYEELIYNIASIAVTFMLKK
jgi:uncharacterized protein YprB with RNaseH-like and TPR domain